MARDVDRTRPWFALVSLLQVFAFTVTPGGARGADLPQKPNVIFILTDDQGYGELACHGNPIIKTPNLDRLHSESIRFTDFQVSPTCSPTRASWMTGRHEFRSGVTHTINERERLSLKAVTIAQVLKSASYTTGIFGKWHLGDEAPYQPDQRGFDEVFIHGAGGIGQTYPGSCGDAPGNTYFNPAILHNRVFEKTQGFCTDVFFRQATQWIDRKRQEKRPFFAYIATNAPHAPYVCPEKYLKMYEGSGLGKDAMAYYGMITNIDENIGKLMAKLKEWNLEKDTLVIFMTDNGHPIAKLYNAGMRGAKGGPYQGGTRVPLFLRWPGTLRGGIDIDKLAAHIDLFPTLAELAGAKIPEGPQSVGWGAAPASRDHGNAGASAPAYGPAGATIPEGVKLDGRSLVPLLKDPSAPWPDRFLFVHLGRWPKGKAKDSKYAQCAVRNGRFRLVNNRELYDIKADPGEKTSVIAEHPDVVAQMRAAYDRWWEELLPALVNEDAVGPPVNPFKELYWKQFGGGPKR
jgi:arylsulfatase A-like enzyme